MTLVATTFCTVHFFFKVLCKKKSKLKSRAHFGMKSFLFYLQAFFTLEEDRKWWNHTMHTVSFDWFLSGLEWNLNLEFCLLKLLIFYQKLLWNIRYRLNSSTFWVFEPVFRYFFIKIEAFCTKNEDFDQIYVYTLYRLKKSKCGRVKPRSDIPYNFW